MTFPPGALIRLKNEQAQPLEQPTLFLETRSLRRVKPEDVLLVIQCGNSRAIALLKGLVGYVLVEYFKLVD